MKPINLKDYLKNFHYSQTTVIENHEINHKDFTKFGNEFWTSKQRQSNSLHEIAYRACFKAELPRFFIEMLTNPGDIVYDPFSGRGTTIIEAALLGRNVISNDTNPISKILVKPRLSPPKLDDLAKRLYSITIDNKSKAEVDLSSFYHPQTESEIISIRSYLEKRKKALEEDELDEWIRMVGTNRLTGHSSGFFSVYTLPPNQAITAERQKRINIMRNQIPEYRDTRQLILKKTKNLINDVTNEHRNLLTKAKKQAKFLEVDSRKTKEIKSNSVQLTVTSPPFLDTVNYIEDNWLRCWFNLIDPKEIAGKITMAKKLKDWEEVMEGTLKELFRVTKKNGYVAFEVGEVRNGKVNLDDIIAPLGIKVGFDLVGIMINKQIFTKTSNIWGVSNNKHGTNSNRIVIFNK